MHHCVAPTLTGLGRQAPDAGRNFPRLLFVGAYLPVSRGSRAVSEDVAARLAADGWSVRLTSRRVARLARLADMVATAWRLRDAYDVAQVDVYSGAAFRWAEAVCGALRAARRPYVLTLHGGNLPALIAREPARVRRLLAGAAAVTAPSRYLQDAARPLRADVRLLPNPLDVGAIPHRLRAAPAPRLVWLRTFHAIYNPRLAVDVVARLADDVPDVTLTMIGPDKDGSLEAARRHADALGVAARVTFPGGVAKADVPACLQAGDVFLNTTDADNTPVSVLEAMAAGLPVVSTNVGGLPYLLADGRDALLVPPRDADAMAGAVRRVLREPGLAARLSGEARRTVERFAWDEVLPQWKSLLADVAEPGARRHA